MEHKFELSEQPTQPVLSVRTRTSVGNLPQELGQAYQAIIEYLEGIGGSPAGAPFAAYYNLDIENLDVEMGFPVAKQLPGQGEIKAGEIPAGKQLSYLHKGPYAASESAYKAMLQWIAKNGHIATGVAYEFYLNNPCEVPESELLTRIVFPLK